MLNLRCLLWVVAATIGLAGCKTDRTDEVDPQPKVAAAAPAAKAAQPKKEQGKEQRGQGGSCADHQQNASPMLKGVKQNTADRGEVMHWGDAFSDAAKVTVGELAGDPGKWADEQVTLEGDVADMCHHRRRWFALVDQKTGAHVRLFTAPRFLVPSDAVGKSVKAQGKVAVFEVPAAQAKHISKEHKLGDPEAIKGDVHKEVIVRVDVAEIW